MADVYLDACCFIYLVEGEPAWRSSLARSLRALPPNARVATSQLSRLECRTKPVRDGDDVLLARYDAVFAASGIAVLDLTASVVDAATLLRAKYGLKAPDALASAIECGAIAFWTGDASLMRCKEVSVTLLAAATP